MKKNYLIPETECAVIGAIFTVCQGTKEGNNQTGNGKDIFKDDAPKRRVF